MQKIKFVVSLLAMVSGTTLCWTAQAAQILGETCPEQSSGAIGETTSHQAVICASGKWVDPATLPMTRVHVSVLNAKTKSVDQSFDFTNLLGARIVRQTSDGTLVARVAAFNPGNTARVVLDVNANGWQQHVDTVVPIGKPTVVAIGKGAQEYLMKVERFDSN